MVLQLHLLVDSQNRAHFDSLPIKAAQTCVDKFMRQEIPSFRGDSSKPHQAKKLRHLAAHLGSFIDRLNQKIAVHNQGIEHTLLNRVVRLLSCNRHSLLTVPVDKQAVLQKIRFQEATTTIQHAWRCHFRRKLQKKELSYEEWNIQKLEAKWLDDPVQEHARLKKAGAISMHSRALYAQLLFTGKGDVATPLTNLLGRATEIKERYKKTHYCFTHGQSLPISLINQTLRETCRLFTPQYHHPHAPTFRIPGKVPFTANIEAFFKKYDVDSPTFVDDHINTELLSVDGYFWNTNPWESAIHFLIQNTNICSHADSNKILELLKGILKHYLPNNFICDRLGSRLQKLKDKIQSESKIGLLYALLVPKVLMQDPRRNFVYRAHPFGRRCSCHPGNHLSILERLQKEERIPCKTFPSYNPQYRFLASRLLEDGKGGRTLGVRAITLDPRNQQNRLETRQEVQRIIEALHFYSRLFALKKPFTIQEESQFLSAGLKLVAEPHALDTAILLPLLRRRCREGLIQVATKTIILQRFGIIDRGNSPDEYWIDERVDLVNLRSLWSAVGSFFGGLKFW